MTATPGGTPDDEAAPQPEPPRSGMAPRSIFLTYGTNFAVALCSLVNVLVISRVLGPEARGEVAFLITVSSVAGQLACFSVQEANANIGGSRAEARGRLASNSIVLAIAFGALAAVIVELLVYIFPAVGGPVSATLFAVALAAIPLVILRLYLSFLLQAEYAFEATNLAWLSGPLISLTVNALFAALGWLTVTTAFVVWTIAQGIGVVILLVRIRRGAGFDRPERRLAGEAMRFGGKAHPGRLMGVGHYRADQWIVGSVAGSKELGWYNVATSWAELLFYLPGVLTLVQRPDLVRAAPQDAARLAARVFRITVILTVVAASGLALLAPILVTVVFGSAFSEAVPMVRILALGAVGIAAIDLLPNALTAQRMPVRGMWAIGATFIVTLALDILLIPHFGGIGASIASATAYSVGGVCAVLIFARSFSIGVGQLIPRRDDLHWMVTTLRRVTLRGPAQ